MIITDYIVTDIIVHGHNYSRSTGVREISNFPVCSITYFRPKELFKADKTRNR